MGTRGVICGFSKNHALCPLNSCPLLQARRKTFLACNKRGRECLKTAFAGHFAPKWSFLWLAAIPHSGSFSLIPAHEKVIWSSKRGSGEKMRQIGPLTPTSNMFFGAFLCSRFGQRAGKRQKNPLWLFKASLAFCFTFHFVPHHASTEARTEFSSMTRQKFRLDHLLLSPRARYL